MINLNRKQQTRFVWLLLILAIFGIVLMKRYFPEVDMSPIVGRIGDLHP